MVQTATTSSSQDPVQESQPHNEAPQGQAHTGPSHAPPVPFPKDCKACKGAVHMLDAFKHMSLRNKQEQVNGSSAKSNTTGTQQAPSTAPHQQQPQQGEEEQASSSLYGAYGLQCPPDTAELGHASWVFLHSMAAHYPEEPTRAQQTLMRNMIDAVAEFYPCSYCRAHFQSEVDPNPPDTSSNFSLSLWLCDMHNKCALRKRGRGQLQCCTQITPPIPPKGE